MPVLEKMPADGSWATCLAANGWPELAMAAALRHENSSASGYAIGLPTQLLSVGLLVTPLAIAGFARLWRTPGLRFIAVAATLMVVYVLAWIPGKGDYTDGLAPAVLAAGCAAAGAHSSLPPPVVRWATPLGDGLMRIRRLCIPPGQNKTFQPT